MQLQCFSGKGKLVKMEEIIEFLSDLIVDAIPTIFIISVIYYLTLGGGFSLLIKLYTSWMWGV